MRHVTRPLSSGIKRLTDTGARQSDPPSGSRIPREVHVGLRLKAHRHLPNPSGAASPRFCQQLAAHQCGTKVSIKPDPSYLVFIFFILSQYMTQMHRRLPSTHVRARDSRTSTEQPPHGACCKADRWVETPRVPAQAGGNANHTRETVAQGTDKLRACGLADYMAYVLSSGATPKFFLNDIIRLDFRLGLSADGEERCQSILTLPNPERSLNKSRRHSSQIINKSVLP
jgi:hypothetical protein